MPPWTVIVPSTDGAPTVIQIPCNVEMDDFKLPPQVRHVSTNLRIAFYAGQTSK